MKAARRLEARFKSLKPKVSNISTVKLLTKKKFMFGKRDKSYSSHKPYLAHKVLTVSLDEWTPKQLSIDLSDAIDRDNDTRKTGPVSISLARVSHSSAPATRKPRKVKRQ